MHQHCAPPVFTLDDVRPVVVRLPLPVSLELPAAHGATGGVLENFDALGIAAVLDIAGSLHSDDVLLPYRSSWRRSETRQTRTRGSARAGVLFPPRLQWARRRSRPLPTRT